MDAKSGKHIKYKLSDQLSYLSTILDANTFVSTECIFFKIDNDLNDLVLFSFVLEEKYGTFIFKCLIGSDNTLLNASCVKTLDLNK